MPTEDVLYKKYGVTVSGFCRAVIDSLSGDLSRSERADYLAYLGMIAHVVELQFAFEDSGVAYFVAARALVPDHTMACIYLIRTYRELPDGHDDLELARDCYRILKRKQSSFASVEAQVFDSVLSYAEHNGVRLADLE